jgi:hypothetical protein
MATREPIMKLKPQITGEMVADNPGATAVRRLVYPGKPDR